MEIAVSVPTYEEHTDQNGQLVTYYIVQVEYKVKNLRYSLFKRYTEFANLHAILKERFSEMEHFRFPNKSMFNTHSQFTKERRRDGFDEFVKLAMKITPMPPEFEEFLEIKGHLARLQQVQGFARAVSGDRVPSKSENTRSSNLEPQFLDKIPSPSNPTTGSSERIEGHRKATMHEMIRGQLPSVVKSSFLLALIIYGILVYFGVIASSSSSIGL